MASKKGNVSFLVLSEHTQTYCHDTMMTQVERREFVCSYGAVTHTHTHTRTQSLLYEQSSFVLCISYVFVSFFVSSASSSFFLDSLFSDVLANCKFWLEMVSAFQKCIYYSIKPQELNSITKSH